MDNELHRLALKNTLNEIQKACPDITNTFIFREDGKTIARDENTPEKSIVHVVNAFDGVVERSEAIGGVKSITLKGSNGRVDVSHVNDLYLVTVTSRKADMNYVNTVTRVLITTVLKLLEKIHPAPLKSKSTSPKIPIVKESEEHVEETETEKPKETEEDETKPEPMLPEPPANQLIVESLSGFLVPSDTVRIDGKILSRWEDLYEDRKIEEVEIETFDGKTARCKVKPIKDSKSDGRGVIQMPEKIKTDLEVRKGELVRIKPIVE